MPWFSNPLIFISWFSNPLIFSRNSFFFPSSLSFPKNLLIFYSPSLRIPRFPSITLLLTYSSSFRPHSLLSLSLSFFLSSVVLSLPWFSHSFIFGLPWCYPCSFPLMLSLGVALVNLITFSTTFSLNLEFLGTPPWVYKRDTSSSSSCIDTYLIPPQDSRLATTLSNLIQRQHLAHSTQYSQRWRRKRRYTNDLLRGTLTKHECHGLLIKSTHGIASSRPCSIYPPQAYTPLTRLL